MSKPRQKKPRIDHALRGKLDTLDAVIQLLGPDFDEAKSVVKRFREDLLYAAAEVHVPGVASKVGSDKWYIAQAEAKYGSDGSVEVDDDAIVSRGGDRGAYVQSWVWVDSD